VSRNAHAMRAQCTLSPQPPPLLHPLRSHLDIAGAAMRVMSHQEKIAEFDRQCEERQRIREQQQRLREKQQQQLQQQQQGQLLSRSAVAAAAAAGPRSQPIDQQQQSRVPAPQQQQEQQQAAPSSAAAAAAAAKSNGSSSAGAGGSSTDDDEAGADEASGSEAGCVPMEELIARSRLEEASLNLVMEAMWAANVVDIQATLAKVCRRVLHDKPAGRAVCKTRAQALRCGWGVGGVWCCVLMGPVGLLGRYSGWLGTC